MKGFEMETQQLHRGRLIDHVHLVVKDFEKSFRFYAGIFEALNIPLGGKYADSFWYDELFISTADSKAALGKLTGRVHLAFQAKDKEMVQRFHSAGLKAGGQDFGQPGERPYHPGYYGAFLTDPDGNNIEAVFHGPAERSADSIVINF